MRKSQKQEVEDLLSQMMEAHGQIKKYIVQGSIPQAMQLLEDCQNGAVTIGTFIENTEGEGHAAIAFLEEYCEIVYLFYQNLAGDSREINASHFEKILQQKLTRAAACVRADIPVRTEVVFLPYKACMWDSLESV